ncbi:MAG: helix-turn-helix transcriptional regulator [Candidatus Wallbacteria bacterium]|nr:helix-turn-helix transcriptional regulator [Candidatus Wallbacteria bacterium]
MKPEKAFGIVLRGKRKKSGISQEKLAQDSGLDRTYISLLERGLRQPTLKTMISISKALELDLLSLISEVLKVINED